MFGFRDAFFYLIAFQVTLIKFLKKIYFTTNYYNKSLKSKIPNQVYFNPNSYLLSIISPYTNESFKVGEINPNEFWLENKQKNIAQHHNFLWLSLINRKTDGKNIQKIIYLWMLKYSNFKKTVWETSTLSTRVISWLLNIDIIISNGTFEFKKDFFQSIILQCNHLKKNIRFEKDPLKKVEILTALILSGIVFKEYENNYSSSIKDLEKFVKSYYDVDGYPLTRSTNDLIFVTKYLLICFENIRDAQKYIPEFLDDLIKKNLACIKFFTTPNNQIPLFNGASENSISNFDKYLANN